MLKRGQVTVFIIVGIILILSIASLFIFLQKKQVFIEEDRDEIKPVELIIEDCLGKTIEEGILYTGLRGGYFNLPNDSIDSVPVLLEKKKIKIPNFEKEFEDYLNLFMHLCVNDLDKLNLTISTGNISSDVKFSNNFVDVKMKFPIEIKTDQKNIHLEDFQVKKEFNLSKYFTFVKWTLNETENTYCISCHSDYLVANNLTIFFDDQGNYSIINVIDNNYLINDEKYAYRFAMRLE